MDLLDYLQTSHLWDAHVSDFSFALSFIFTSLSLLPFICSLSVSLLMSLRIRRSATWRGLTFNSDCIDVKCLTAPVSQPFIHSLLIVSFPPTSLVKCAAVNVKKKEHLVFNYSESFDQLLHISLYISPALHKLLQVVLPCFLEAVRQDRERQVVMAVLESMNAVIKSCQGEALQAPGRLAEISNAIKDVLKKKVRI